MKFNLLFATLLLTLIVHHNNAAAAYVVPLNPAQQMREQIRERNKTKRCLWKATAITSLLATTGLSIPLGIAYSTPPPPVKPCPIPMPCPIPAPCPDPSPCPKPIPSPKPPVIPFSDIKIRNCKGYYPMQIFGLCLHYPSYNEPFFKDNISKVCNDSQFDTDPYFDAISEAQYPAVWNDPKIYMWTDQDAWQSSTYERKGECTSFPELLDVISNIEPAPKPTLDTRQKYNETMKKFREARRKR